MRTPPAGRAAIIATLLAVTAHAQEPASQTFRAATRVVSVDVVVHDKDGRPVADLAAADFNVFEDGKEQRIELFTVVGSRPTAGRFDPASTAAASDGTLRETNRGDGNRNVSATVILFDRLNTRFEDQVSARGEIVKFLSTIRPEDRVALYVLDSNAIRVLHDFTSDSTSLVRAIARYRSATSAEQAATDERVPQPAFIGSAHEDAEMAAWLQEKTEMVAAEFLRRRGVNTLAALEAIADHLADLRGRKNLVWVSSAFPLVISDQFGPRTLSEEVTRAVRAVSSANITIYPVDTRGLIAPNSTPDATATQAVMPGRQPAQRSTPGTMTAMMPNVDSMTELAARTGGRAFYNTNNIGRAIARAIDDGRITYVLGYSPSSDAADGRFRTLKVTVRRPDVDVRHRSGYLAIPANAAKPARLADIARAPLTASAIGLTVDVGVADRAPSARTVAIRVDPSGVTLHKNGESWETALDLLIAHTQANGELVADLETTLNLRLTSEQRDQLLRDGFSMSRTVDLRAGATRVHVVVRDRASTATGSVTLSLAPVR